MVRVYLRTFVLTYHGGVDESFVGGKFWYHVCHLQRRYRIRPKLLLSPTGATSQHKFIQHHTSGRPKQFFDALFRFKEHFNSSFNQSSLATTTLRSIRNKHHKYGRIKCNQTCKNSLEGTCRYSAEKSYFRHSTFQWSHPHLTWYWREALVIHGKFELSCDW